MRKAKNFRVCCCEIMTQRVLMCHVRERSAIYIIRKVMPHGTDEKGQASPRSCYHPEAVCSYVSLPGIVSLLHLPLLTGSGVFLLPGSRRRATNASSNPSLYATGTILCAMGSDVLLLKSLYPAMYLQAFSLPGIRGKG